VNDVDQSHETGRQTGANGRVEDLLGHLVEAVELSAPTGQHNPATKGDVACDRHQVLANEAEDLLRSRLQNVRQLTTWNDAGAAAADTRHGHTLVRFH
jgi:hypothetical protein